MVASGQAGRLSQRATCQRFIRWCALPIAIHSVYRGTLRPAALLPSQPALLPSLPSLPALPTHLVGAS